MLRHIIIISYILPISLHEINFNLVTLFSLPSSSSPALFQNIKNKIFELILSRNFHHACRVCCLWPPCVVFIPWYFTGRFLWTLTSRTDDLKCWEISPFSSVAQLCPAFCDPMDCSTPGLPLHHQLLEFTQTNVHWVVPSNHFILCCPLLLPPSIFLSIRVFSNDSLIHIRWPKYWSFSFSISPSNEYSGLISFRMDWIDLLAVQGTLKSLLQHHSINSLALSFLYSPTLTSIHDHWKYHSFD